MQRVALLCFVSCLVTQASDDAAALTAKLTQYAKVIQEQTAAMSKNEKAITETRDLIAAARAFIRDSNDLIIQCQHINGLRQESLEFNQRQLAWALVEFKASKTPQSRRRNQVSRNNSPANNQNTTPATTFACTPEDDSELPAKDMRGLQKQKQQDRLKKSHPKKN